jgi:hypothetical protein
MVAMPCDNADALDAADWLCLAAAPTFAFMAALTWVSDGDTSDILCAAAQDASQLSGMFLMYALMSAAHLAPWLKLVSRRRSGGRYKAALPMRPRSPTARFPG